MFAICFKPMPMPMPMIARWGCFSACRGGRTPSLPPYVTLCHLVGMSPILYPVPCNLFFPQDSQGFTRIYRFSGYVCDLLHAHANAHANANANAYANIRNSPMSRSSSCGGCPPFLACFPSSSRFPTMFS